MSLRFTHPVVHTLMNFDCPLPKDLEAWLRRLKTAYGSERVDGWPDKPWW
jgi:hypothetical protein